MSTIFRHAARMIEGYVTTYSCTAVSHAARHKGLPFDGRIMASQQHKTGVCSALYKAIADPRCVLRANSAWRFFERRFAPEHLSAPDYYWWAAPTSADVPERSERVLALLLAAEVAAGEGL